MVRQTRALMPIATINGLEQHYEEVGQGSPVVLIHGMGLDLRMWDEQVPALARHFSTIRYDVRGHGRSAKPPTGYRDEHFEDLRHLLDHLRIDRAHLVGLSMGAEIAVGFTLRHPERVRSLIAVDPYVAGYRYRHWAFKTVWTIARAEGPKRAVAYWITDPIFAAAMRRPEVAARLREIVADHSGVMWADRGVYPKEAGPRPPSDFERLEAITVPTLVVCGEHDLPDFRTIADGVAARVPGARQVTVPDAGHMSPMEQPAAVNWAVVQFLLEIEGARPEPVDAEVVVLPDPEAVAREAAARFARLAQQTVAERGQFAVALSGGSTPRELYALLSASPYHEQVPWPGVHLFWGDERCVPPDDPQSNYRLVRETLLEHVPFPAANVHRIRAELSPDVATEAYARELRRFFAADEGTPRFDLVLLGMGPDGHTASLFPGTAGLEETGRAVVANWVPQQGVWRITLTYPTLNAARRVIFLVTGAAKAEPLRDVLHPSPHRPALPVQRVRPTEGTLTWLVDKAAATQIKAPPR